MFMTWFLNRKLAGHKGVGWCTQNAGRKNKIFQSRLLYPRKLFFRSEWSIDKTILNKQNLREFISTGLALEEMIKGAIQVEIKRH